jgi:hypothetical protein
MSASTYLQHKEQQSQAGMVKVCRTAHKGGREKTGGYTMLGVTIQMTESDMLMQEVMGFA